MSEFTTCPWPDCGSIAEITRRDVLESTDGPIEHLGTFCLQKHGLYMPASYLDRWHEQDN